MLYLKKKKKLKQRNWKEQSTMIWVTCYLLQCTCSVRKQLFKTNMFTKSAELKFRVEGSKEKKKIQVFSNNTKWIYI